MHVEDVLVLDSVTQLRVTLEQRRSGHCVATLAVERFDTPEAVTGTSRELVIPLERLGDVAALLTRLANEGAR